MTDNSTQQASGGIGFCGLLTIVFITLKLTHTIDWSWWWVTAPLWLPITLLLAGMAIFALLAAVWTFTPLLWKR